MNRFDDDRPCTVEELLDIITAAGGGMTLLPSTAYDLVLPNIFIGEGYAALRINCMKRLGVTHVLNAALGKDRYHVNSNHVMYQKAGIQFLGIEATDFMNCDLAKYFDKATDFIDKGLESGGKIFVHCVQGVSRSATLVLAYLMLKRHMTVQDALRLVRSRREICPNDGFLQQLCDLNEKLKKSGHFGKEYEESKAKHKEWTESLSASVQVEEGGKDGVRGDTAQLKESDSVESTKYMTDEKLDADSKGVENVTVQELENLLTAQANGLMLLPKTVHSRINEHIFIGDGTIAVNMNGLKTLGISHILNAAHNKGVSIDSKRYKANSIEYLGLELEDTHRFDLTPHLFSAADFIHSATVHNGQVLVNCVQGASRSASLVVAYFMIKHHMSVQSALQLVRARREICPNAFFLQQLCDLNARLKKT